MKTLEADVVVIGGGGAGLPAALTAVEKGISRVVLLEKRATVGGNASMAGGFLFAAESRPQREAGVEISRDSAFKEAMAFHHYDRVNPRILRAFIDKSADTIQWLEDRGAEYEWSVVMGAHALKHLTAPVGGFGRVIKAMTERYQAGGGKVLKKAEAKKILRGPDGKVCGVISTGKEGEEIQISTKCVILATGGFTGNRELLKKYFPYYYDEVYWTDAVPHKGDGIQLAAEAGAELMDFCTLVRETGYSFQTKKSMPNRLAMEPSSIWVNKNGVRFADETVYMNDAATNALLAQPERIGFALYDERLIQSMMDNPPPLQGPDPIDIRKVLQTEAAKGAWSKISDAWEDIALWIGADPKVLKATIEEYNSFCDRGHDDLFAKGTQCLMPLRIAPFYALKFRPLMIETVGPVKVNERMEVLDPQGNAIPGFYAGGAITSGWQSYDYHLSGSALGYSVNSGRIAGENAAKFLRSRETLESTAGAH